MSYTCPSCGKTHEEWPALAYSSPYHYNVLSDEDMDSMAELTSDTCMIRHEAQTDRFIRVVMIQQVNDHCEDLHYGVWVSLSEKSYNDYLEHYYDKEYKATYFGYLCSQFPWYEKTFAVKMNVEVDNSTGRPEVIPHDDQPDKKIVEDYYNGISREEAERRIQVFVDMVG